MVVLYYNLNTISIAILRKNIAFLRIFGVFKGKNRVFRDEGISRKKDINWFSLLPFPLSLTIKAKPLRHAEEKTALRRVMIGISVNRSVLLRFFTCKYAVFIIQ